MQGLTLHKLEVLEIDGELGFVLPAEVIQAMSLKEGSSIVAIVDSRGIFLKADDTEPSVRDS